VETCQIHERKKRLTTAKKQKESVLIEPIGSGEPNSSTAAEEQKNSSG
jgi:hypothetical protein